MRDLYTRLKERGFDSHFIKATVLPDWWEDSLAAEPANRAIAETAIARQLGFKVAALRKRDHPLPAPQVPNFRLKRSASTQPEELRPWIVVAERLARLVHDRLSADVQPFSAMFSPAEARSEILSSSAVVDLPSLVRFAWDKGIVVLHMNPERLPSGKKFQGMAMFCGDRPMILLAAGTDSPPWLAFHLAHEMGHIWHQHVKPHDKPLIDSKIDHSDDDQQERQADEFATVVLTGKPRPEFEPEYGLTGPKLAKAAASFGTSHGIAPGTVALIYARSAQRWGPAQIALKKLGEHQGGRAIIAKALLRRLHLDDLPESTARFLNCLSGVDCDGHGR